MQGQGSISEVHLQSNFLYYCGSKLSFFKPQLPVLQNGGDICLCVADNIRKEFAIDQLHSISN